MTGEQQTDMTKEENSYDPLSSIFDPNETQKLPSTLNKEQQSALRKYLDRCNTELLFINAKNKKRKYIDNMMDLYSPQWWDSYTEMRDSGIPELMKVAFQEYNKLQIKRMPVELAGKDGEDIVFKIVDYTLRPTIDIDPVEAETEDATAGDTSTL